MTMMIFINRRIWQTDLHRYQHDQWSCRSMVNLNYKMRMITSPKVARDSPAMVRTEMQSVVQELHLFHDHHLKRNNEQIPPNLHVHCYRPLDRNHPTSASDRIRQTTVQENHGQAIAMDEETVHYDQEGTTDDQISIDKYSNLFFQCYYFTNCEIILTGVSWRSTFHFDFALLFFLLK